MILEKEFYERETITVARQLIGKKLTRKIKNTKLTGIITETEAYRGKDDSASHAATNLTKRNSIMFGPAGMSYVYFTYGMYFMLNVIAKSKKQNAGAVLIRGIYPQDGIEIMIKNRGMKDINNITNGPGKLTIAMNISMKENNLDLTKKSSIYISEGITPKKINKLPRIGISKAVDKKWNFSINSKDYF
ncbi:DNA-3-methyladenine glycosylase [Candidatus Nitrosopelagicus sp.]|nr:DNA-3-methyladenine glycosylase [Candidatus Nitrosopelagicus sp.]